MSADEAAAHHFADSLPVMTFGDVPKCVTTEIASRDVSRTTPLQTICGLGMVVLAFVIVGWVL